MRAPRLEARDKKAPAGWRALGRAERPALTREALHLISADHRVPARRARSELGHEPRVGYADAMSACTADLAQRGLLAGEPMDDAV